jgi:hypothetical protein
MSGLTRSAVSVRNNNSKSIHSLVAAIRARKAASLAEPVQPSDSVVTACCRSSVGALRELTIRNPRHGTGLPPPKM